jgi:outer membrane protein assembly factor BamA
VPEGDFLYKGARVTVSGDEIRKHEQQALSEDLESILRPKHNKRFLGIPIKLLIYSFWGKPEKDKGLGNWISRKAGEAPVLLSDVRRGYQTNLILNRLENRGYFHAQVESDSTASKRKITLEYHVEPGKQFLIDTIYFPADSGVLSRAIRETSAKSFLKQKHAFDLDVIKAERERINARLKEQGFYYFNPDHLLILVDSTNSPFAVSLAITIKAGTPALAHEKFTIDRIFIFPASTLSRDTITMEGADTVDGLTIVDPGKTFKPAMFTRALTFKHGDLYNRTDHNRSLNRLIDLGVFKYVENRFVETGNSRLDAYYYLTPIEKKSFWFELTGRSTSSNFAGAEAVINWQNRNTFRAAENLRIKVYGGTDVQISGINRGNDLYRYGAEINLNIPRFVTPFKVTTPSAFMPRTKGTIGYDVLNRVNSYELNSFRTSFGYQWKESVQKEHQLSILSVTYVQPTRITQEYQDKIDEDPTLANAIQRQFIFGSVYNYNVTNTAEKSRKHTYYFNCNLDLSGNIVGILSGANYKTDNTKEIFNAIYAQYAKMESDLRYYNNLGRGDFFAARLFAGLGYAYGNSKSIPFVKQFFAGGTTGLRAFRARSLGPGTFRADNIGQAGVIAADQAGDLKLEASIEYRPEISGILKGAIFVDAGNIWLLRSDPDRPGAEIGSDFISEIAADFGVGLRFDFSFFVLRADLAMPIRKPWYPEKHRWVFNEISLGSSDWRRENLVFNLAIDYPF